jgi:hypothetical protein
MRFRFSLRTLLVLTTLAAVVCGWLTVPTLRAYRFDAAIARGDLEAANRMFLGVGTALTEWRARPAIDGIRAEVLPLTWPDLAVGRRRMWAAPVAYHQYEENGTTFYGHATAHEYIISMNVLGATAPQLVPRDE